MKSQKIASHVHYNNTIVTACDKAYLWGALMLIGSIRMNGCQLPIQVHTHGLNPQDIDLLLQFANIEVIPTLSSAPHLNKPKALLYANTEYRTWIDADCIFKGNLEKLLTPHNTGIHMRFREAEENQFVYSKLKKKNEDGSTIPSRVLNQWQKDVSERQSPIHQTQCVTNFISVHNDSLRIVQKWGDQIDLLGLRSNHTVDKSNLNYFMTDESVLSSLLSFSFDSPEIYPYQLDKIKHQRLVHFGMSLKPWKIWKKNHLLHFDYVMQVIHYLQSNVRGLPNLPYSLNPDNKRSSSVLAEIMNIYHEAKYALKFIF